MGFGASLAALSLHIMHWVLRALLYSPAVVCKMGSLESVSRYLSLHVPASFMTSVKTLSWPLMGPGMCVFIGINGLSSCDEGSCEQAWHLGGRALGT